MARQSFGQQKLFALVIILFAGLGGILYGYDIGIIAGALIFMKHEIALNVGQVSILIAAVLGGGSIATLISGPLADWLGRRTMLTVSAVVFISGIIVLVSSHSFAGVLTGRLIEGVGVGVITMIVPLYLAESAPASVRGSGVTAFQLFLTLGILVAYLVALLFAHSGNWRGMFLCALVPGALFFIGSLLIIESPRWLFFKDKKEQAIAALQRSRSETEVEHDIYMMTKIDIERKQQNVIGQESLWQKHYLLPFLLAFSIACLTQLTGINVFLQLCTLILQHAGLQSNVVSMLGSVGIGVVNFIVTLIAMLLVDKIGRKPLLIFGASGIVIALFYLGVISWLFSPSLLQGYLTIAGLLLFIASFAIGPGVVVWIAISELMPMPIRSKGMAICLFANCLASTVLASVFLKLTHYIGYTGVFWMCGIFTLLYLAIAIFFLPETKGKSLEEIEQCFRDGVTATPTHTQ
ncbi:MAG: sugar porter family MFS transporter [Gammaproteobacteria bacterium]|nr:sugar porter family MFS transporter [Gammaproteobacteria bacterium]